jgi:hypothetical protein
MRKLLVAVLMFAASPALAEDNLKPSAIDASVRTLLAFKVPDAVVQKYLPPGFESNPPAAGPAKGSNLGITLIDYIMVQDPDGKPMPPRNAVVINMPAKKTATGEAVAVVFNGFTVPAGVPGPYSVFGPADITIDRTSHTDPDGKEVVKESWQAKGTDGSALAISLEFIRGTPARGKVEAKLHSAAKPDFFRVYRYEQGADVVRSTATGVDRAINFSFKATGPRLAPIFDGNEQLLAITSVPHYSRTIYLQAM